MTSTTIRTSADVDALPVTGARYRAWDAIEKGLCVRVGASGSKVWQFEYRDPKGRRQCVRLGSCERLKPGEARKAARRLGADPAADRRAEKANLKAEKVAKREAESRVLRTFIEGPYAAELKRARSGAATKARLLKDWASLLDRRMDEITPLDIERIRRRRLKLGVLPQTCNRSWSALRAALNAGVRQGVIAANPIAPKQLARLPEPDDRRVRWLGQRDPGERARFLEALAQAPEHARIVIQVAYYTGLRRGEVFGLTWGEVDLERRLLTVRAHTSKANRTRHVPMPQALVDVLVAWRPEGAELGDLVVASPKTGERLVHVNRAWSSLTKRAKLEDFRLHDLRHDFATRLLQSGAPLHVVRELLGHTSVALSERYAHVAPGRLRDAVEALR